MTPTGLREKIIAERAAWVRERVAGIRSLPLEDYTAFAGDRRNVAAAESYLRRALEALIDLGRHVLAKGFGLVAAEYRDVPERLQQSGVLARADADLLGVMARYRNRLVHFSHEVTSAELYDLCAHRLEEVERVLEALLAWVRAHPEKIDRTL